jgi:Zn-dependent metalloprotease
MSRLNAIVGCAAASAAVLFLNNSPITGQPQDPTEDGHSFPIHASGAALPAELEGIDAMLRVGDLDISSLQEDTVIPGRVHERLKQMYSGLPVFGSEVVRQMDGRSIVSLSGRLYDNITIDATPQLSSAQAADIAVSSSGEGANVRGEPTLGMLPVGGEGYKLAYRMQVRSNWDVREIAVDALSGAIIYSRSLIESVNAVGQGTGVLGDTKKMSVNSTTSSFQAIDGMRPASAFTLDFRGSLSRLNNFLATGFLFNSDIATDSDNVWTDTPTVDAHVYQGWVYDYYFKRHGRRGLDDHNLEIDGIVHPIDRSQASRQPSDIVGTFINNAFFCCDGLMVYGDGDGRNYTYMAGALDVVGHEMSHGVTQYTSNLAYHDESGALNEAFSDIMGASIEYFFQPPGSGPNKADWLIAEDVTLAFPGYIRSLNNPNAIGDPDHYSLRRFLGTSTDNGGVHFNMTIATHAFYLAVSGGRNRVSGITVTGVGLNNIDRMEKIFYRGWVFLMPANSKFSDARAATLQAASDLYGAGSNERAQVEAAWNAVGVN